MQYLRIFRIPLVSQSVAVLHVFRCHNCTGVAYRRTSKLLSLLLGADSVVIADVDTCKEETYVVVAFVFKDDVELFKFFKMVAIVFIVHQLATSKLL